MIFLELSQGDGWVRVESDVMVTTATSHRGGRWHIQNEIRGVAKTLDFILSGQVSETELSQHMIDMHKELIKTSMQSPQICTHSAN